MVSMVQGNSGSTWHSGSGGQQHKRPALNNLIFDDEGAHDSLAHVISQVRLDQHTNLAVCVCVKCLS